MDCSVSLASPHISSMLLPDHADMGSKTTLPDNDSSPTPAVSTLHPNIGPLTRAKVEASLTHKNSQTKKNTTIKHIQTLIHGPGRTQPQRSIFAAERKPTCALKNTIAMNKIMELL